MGFEFSEMHELRANLVKIKQKSEEIHMKIANRVALLAIRKVKKMTPVDNNILRPAWKHSVVKKGDAYHIQIYNEVEYASYVESGHRIVVAGKTVGWVEGRFMMKLTLDEMKQIAPNMWKKEVEKEMRRIFGS